MLGSPILDVAIGLILIFLLLSIIASAVREWIEAILRSRAAQLERGIRELLADPGGVGLAKSVYDHPLISGLYRGTYDGPRMAKGKIAAYRSQLPSYIPKENFALALIDLVVRGNDMASATQASAGSPRIEFDTIRAQIGSLQNPAVQRVMLTALDTAGGDVERLRRNLEDWFDGSMDRVSGWFKRESTYLLLVIGLVLAIAGNVDTVVLGRYLYDNKGARDALVAEASAVARDSSQLSANAQRVTKQLDNLSLPFGWTRPNAAATPAYVRAQIVRGWFGWILTAYAISFGAPFWFDLLNRFVVIRSTVKPKEKSGDEGSKDRGGASPPPSPPPAPL